MTFINTLILEAFIMVEFYTKHFLIVEKSFDYDSSANCISAQVWFYVGKFYRENESSSFFFFFLEKDGVWVCAISSELH